MASPRPAARRLTEPRICTAAITQNASVAAARNTRTASIMLSPSPNISNRNPPSSMSDPVIDHLVHDEISNGHPGAGGGENDLGEVLLPDAAVEVRCDELDDHEQYDRQRRQDQSGCATLSGQRSDLA